MGNPVTLNSRIAIIGAGIGGLSLALALAKAGAKNIAVYERRNHIEELGAGLQIGPNASRALEKLGLGADLEEVSERFPAGDMFDALTGKRLTELPMDRHAYQAYGSHSYQLLRNDLLQLLWKHLRGAMGCDPVRLGMEYTGLSEQRSKVCFSDGTEESAHLIVGADGVESNLRSDILKESRASYSGFFAWRGLLDLSAANHLRKLDTMQVWMGERKHLIAYPLKGGSLINLVGVSEQADWTHAHAVETLSANAWIEDFSDWCEEPISMIRMLDACQKWSLRLTPPLSSWGKGCVGLLGDAAHPMLPSLAQGAGQAIEDAVCLAKHIGKGEYPAQQLLDRYFSERFERSRRVQQASLWNLKFFHRRRSAGTRLVHLGMRLGGGLTPKIIARRYRWLYSD